MMTRTRLAQSLIEYNLVDLMSLTSRKNPCPRRRSQIHLRPTAAASLRSGLCILTSHPLVILQSWRGENPPSESQPMSWIRTSFMANLASRGLCRASAPDGQCEMTRICGGLQVCITPGSRNILVNILILLAPEV